jgi:F-type H+-transporting ATPase subunit gamma
MANPREILRRIRSVKNIGQVTRAMEAVSASRMRRAQQRTTASREYAEKAREVLSFLASQPGAENAHPLLQERETVRRVALVLVTPNRGLAGALISNILRVAMRFIEQNRDKEIVVVAMGRKGRDFMRRYGPRLIAEFDYPGDNPTTAMTTPMSQLVMDSFLSGEFDAVYLIYAEFVSLLNQRPVVHQLLPMRPETAENTMSAEYLIEPDPNSVLEYLLPALVDMQVYQALLESQASEHSARMVAMRAATDAGKELVEDLRLTYNKARQTAITSEILDIAGGAEALAQSGE